MSYKQKMPTDNPVKEARAPSVLEKDRIEIEEEFDLGRLTQRLVEVEAERERLRERFEEKDEEVRGLRKIVNILRENAALKAELELCRKRKEESPEDTTAKSAKRVCSDEHTKEKITDSSVVKTSNVFIRGLPPDTTEDSLRSMGNEFGSVVSINIHKGHSGKFKGLCAGIGFIDFESSEAAALAITGLNSRGLFAEAARERFRK